MRNLFLCLLISLLIPACDDSSSENNGTLKDVSADFAKGEDVKKSFDAKTLDLSSDAETKTDASSDSGTDVSAGDTGNEDAVSEDVQVDLGDPYQGRPTGQCKQRSDCPNNAECGSIPGGVCLNCAANDANCTGDAICSQFGACIVECQSEADCAPGLSCSGAGRCGAKRCQQGVCPDVLFGCSQSGLCERKGCAADPTVCDPGTVCVEDRCVLDR